MSKKRGKKGKSSLQSIIFNPPVEDIEVNNETMASQGMKIAALSCLESSEYSDLVLKCNGREFKAHKFALCPQSDFFAKAVKENAFQEGKTGVICMDHDDPDAISAMLRFIYTGDYSTGLQTMQAHLKIYELAEKVDIAALKTLSEDKFNTVAKANWKDATFPACMRTAYEISPPGTEELVKLDSGFRQTMEEVAELGADLVETIGGIRKSKFAIKSKGVNWCCINYNCSYKWSGESTASGFLYCPKCGSQCEVDRAMERKHEADVRGADPE